MAEKVQARRPERWPGKNSRSIINVWLSATLKTYPFHPLQNLTIILLEWVSPRIIFKKSENCLFRLIWDWAAMPPHRSGPPSGSVARVPSKNGRNIRFPECYKLVFKTDCIYTWWQKEGSLILVGLTLRRGNFYVSPVSPMTHKIRIDLTHLPGIPQYKPYWNWAFTFGVIITITH
jgi:hypothetical protein